MTEKKWKVLWAKSNPRHALWKHVCDVAAMALALPFPLQNSGWSQEMIAFLAGMHDVGKADAPFQHRVAAFQQELETAGYFPTDDARCRHERLSGKYLKDWLIQRNVPSRTASSLARAVFAHHGHWDEDFRSVGKSYREAQNSLGEMLHGLLGSPAPPSESAVNLSALGMCLTGHIVLSDWIASSEEFFTDPRLLIDEPEKYFSKVREVAEDWVARLGFSRSCRAGNPSAVVQKPRALQKLLLESSVPPGLVIVEAPMGEGKTEAAWILAEKWYSRGYRGMYMALPTMATSDSLYRRYRRDYLEKCCTGEEALLVHGMAWLRDEEEPEILLETEKPGEENQALLAAAWFRPTRKAMLASHGVGTVDQAMLAGMNVKFGFLRLYGLTGRVLVIDEVHAYDAYMSAILARLLQWCACLAIPVILLSATLSSRQRRDMIEAYGAVEPHGKDKEEAAYPLITVGEPGKPVQTHTAAASFSRVLEIRGLPGMLGDAEKTAAEAKKRVEKGGCCCVILNTVKQAQKVYEALSLPGEQKMLFHARFTASHRQELTEKVLRLFGKERAERPEKYVLVATQVVEQSLDVDFDHMISEIAPVDLLLQRSGREHRHVEREHNPVFYVLLPPKDASGTIPDFGGTGYVYAEKLLLRTLALLAVLEDVHLPRDFRPLIEKCYGREQWDQDVFSWDLIEKADEEWEEESKAFRGKGEIFSLREPKENRFKPVENNDPPGDESDDGNGWRASTRLGACEHTALLVEGTPEEPLQKGDVGMEKVRELYKHSLKLPGYLPLFSPSQGYESAVKAQGKLKGLLILPMNAEGVWRGEKDGRTYQVRYHKELGLLAGRLE